MNGPLHARSRTARTMLPSVFCLVLGLVAPGARSEILAVTLGTRGAANVLRPSIGTGDEIDVAVTCSRGDEIRIELTTYADVNGDGVIQELSEMTRAAPMRVKDNGPNDFDPSGGKIVAAIGHLGAGTTSLVVRVSAGVSVKRAALRVHQDAAKEPWWRKFVKLSDISRNLRAPDENNADICVVDLATSRMRHVVIGGDVARPALSHDEGRVAYVSRSPRESKVVLAEIATGREIARIDDAGWPAWLPGDHAVVIVRGRELMLFEVESRTMSRMGVPADRILQNKTKERFTTLIVEKEVDGVDEIDRFDLSPSGAIRATARLHLGSDWDARVSPDGEHFIVVPKIGDVSVVARSTGRQTLLNGEFRGSEPQWSPSGNSIVFSCVRARAGDE